MKSLTPAQRSQNVRQVKDLVTRLLDNPGNQLLRAFGSGSQGMSGLSLRQGDFPAALQEL